MKTSTWKIWVVGIFATLLSLLAIGQTNYPGGGSGYFDTATNTLNFGPTIVDNQCVRNASMLLKGVSGNDWNFELQPITSPVDNNTANCSPHVYTATTNLLQLRWIKWPNPATAGGYDTYWGNFSWKGNNQLTLYNFGFEDPSGCPGDAKQNTYGVCMSPPIAGAFIKDAIGNTVPATAKDFTWNPTAKVWMANVGVKITNPQDIGETLYVTNTYNLNDGELWKKYSADGTIKFAMSDIVIPSEPTRKVMFAYFTTKKTVSGNKMYQRFPVWQDNNSAAWINPPVENGAFGEASDYSYGTKDGFVVHSASGCWESYWNTLINNITSRSAVCKY